jgi:hypothetical protein
MFLYKVFPALYERITVDFIACRDALRGQKRATLRDDVGKAVTELMQRGLHPNVTMLPVSQSPGRSRLDADPTRD